MKTISDDDNDGDDNDDDTLIIRRPHDLLSVEKLRMDVCLPISYIH